MPDSRRKKLASLAGIVVMVAACGTRVDRQAYLRSLNQGGGGQATAQTDQNSGATNGDVGQTSGAAGTAGAGASSANGSSGSSASPGTKGSSGSTGKSSGSTPSLSTAVVGNTIRIGMHVPKTGAAPLPMDWQDAITVIQNYVNETGINGRKIDLTAHIEDDGYDPATGAAACRKLSEENVLFVIGHTAPAVEDECAGLFQSQGIPYLMRGAQPQLLNGRSIAYFGTIPDDVQGGLLGDYVINRLQGRGKVSAVVYENDQAAAQATFVQHVKSGGGTVGDVETSVPRQPDYTATVQNLKNAHAQFVFLSMPPVDAINLATKAQGAAYHPTWLGGGTYWNYNMVLQSAGGPLDGAVSFSPWPTVDSAGASDYRAAYAKYRPGKEPPDIGLVIWGWMMLIKSALTNAGPALSRASFVGALNSLQFSSSSWNPISYTPTDHRGSNAVAVFVADGQAKAWRQVSGFSTSF
jgi:ABC-type branched-subunit amino acid transport system substrate-binding protein